MCHVNVFCVCYVGKCILCVLNKVLCKCIFFLLLLSLDTFRYLCSSGLVLPHLLGGPGAAVPHVLAGEGRHVKLDRARVYGGRIIRGRELELLEDYENGTLASNNQRCRWLEWNGTIIV